jgi:hypothetical protein
VEEAKKKTTKENKDEGIDGTKYFGFPCCDFV